MGDEFDPDTTEIGPYTRVVPECLDAHVIRFDGDGLARLFVVLEVGGSRIDAVILASGPTGAAAPKTESGITLNSDVAAFHAAYPDAEQTREWPDGGAFAVSEGSTWLAFLVDEGFVRSIATSNSESPFREYCA